MTPSFLEDERITALLMERAIDGLDEASRAELRRLSRQYPDYDDGAIDRAAASVSLSGIRVAPVPEDLLRRLDADAGRWLRERPHGAADPRLYLGGPAGG